MTVRSYGPVVPPVLPANAGEVKVTYVNGVVPTFTTPVTVDPTTKAISFALDDGGSPPVKLLIKIQQAGGGSSTTLRVTLPTPAPPNPASSAPVQTAQSGTTYTLVLADANSTVRLTNAATVTVMVPPASSVAWVAGTIINVRAEGAGGVTITPSAGVTIQNSSSGLTQWGEASLQYNGSDVWVRVG